MEHWEHPDKGRHQQPQLQHQAQNHSQQGKPKLAVTTNKSTIIQQTNPIQSIANVLNHHHSKLIQQQKKSQQLEKQETVTVAKNKLDKQVAPRISTSAANGSKSNVTSKESNLSSAFSHSSNQIDQGNSYLYAYNDFVTATNRASSNDLKLASRSHRGLDSSRGKELVDDNGVAVGIENNLSSEDKLCEHLQAPHKSTLNFENNQESLIDSDEDDALSYILHQHRAQRDARHLAAIIGNDTSQQGLHIDSGPNQQYLQQYEEGNGNFEAQRIDHHLSCSRSSHPRHICGIGGSHNDNLNSIAARLKEESQRAFALNQRSRQVHPDLPNHHRHHHHHHLTSNDISSIQSHQFTHDLTIIQDQLANATISVNNQYNNHNQDELALHTSYLNLNNELHLVPADRKTLLLDNANKHLEGGRIINDSSNNSLNEHSQSTSLTQRTFTRTRSNNFLSWLFCCFCNLLSTASPTIQHQQSQANLVQSTTNVKRRHKTANESVAAVGMYTTSQQIGGQLGGQAGAYYATQTPQADALHQAYANHAHHAHHYPLSSESSMGSSVFATSALRMNTFFRSCCSKKCLFVSCLMLILLIFIFVIGLSAYLNFLINSNKTNLTPLSGRLKVESQGDSFVDQLSNRTSKEFLAKQQQYETILRGAFDRTQNLLKSYPNHLVKCEVYSFKPGSLWVYFRLFINKRTLMQDTQLMKRKSPDEHLDKQFLPRITQQTLHSGFEQLVINFNQDSSAANGVERRSRSSQFGSSAELRQQRTVADQRVPSSQRDHVKSFDDQISRLMPIIESIDLQSIIVTPEFDMLQTGAGLSLQQQSMSDNLRASQFLTTSTSAVMVATGTSGNKNAADNDAVGSTSATTTESSSNTSTSPARPTTSQPSVETDISHTGSSDEVNVSTKKFFLYGYKENSTRPTTSSKPTMLKNRAPEQESIFLVNHQQRKPTPSPSSRPNGLNIIPSPNQNSDNNSTRYSNALKEIPASELVDSSNSKENVVKLVSGQPVVNRNISSMNSGDKLPQISRDRITTEFKLDQIPKNNTSSNVAEFTTLDSAKSQVRKDKGVNETVLTQMVAPYQKIGFSLQPQQDLVANSTKPQAKDTFIQDLWDNALGNNKKNITPKIDKQHDAEQPKRLITVTTIGNDNLGSTNNSSGLDWHKISILSSEISNTIRANMNASMQITTFPTSTLASPPTSTTLKPKVSPHLKQGGSLVSAPIRPQQQHETHSAVVLNRDFAAVGGEGEQMVGVARNNSALQMSTRLTTQQNRSDISQKKTSQFNGQRNATLSDKVSNESNRQRANKPTTKPHKFKKVTFDSSQSVARNDTIQPATTASSTTITTTASANIPSVTTISNGTMINSKGIRIVDHFLASINSGRAAELLGQNMNSTAAIVAANLRQVTKNKTQEAFNYNADLILPTLPATIELTRSTTSFPPTRTTSFHPMSDSGWSVGYRTTPVTADHFTTTSSSQTNSRYSTSPATITTESSNKFGAIVSNGPQGRSKNVYMAPNTVHLSNNAATNGANHHSKQQSSTPTSSFSSQWKPITINPTNSTAIDIDESWIKNRTSPRRQNISLIVNERLTPIVNVPSNQGSQSPFAMSTSILENQLKPNGNLFSQQQVARRPNKVLSNPFQIVGGNEFESHRMSRMRMADTTPSIESSGQIQATSTSTTSAPIQAESNTRVVDDFMVTTDKLATDTHSSSLSPVHQPGSHNSEPLARLRAMNPLDLQPKRTRGPFAFETLKSVSISAPSSLVTENADQSADINLQQRSERSPFRQGSDQTLLVRKNLFLGSGDDDEFKTQAPTGNPNVAVEIVDKVSSVEQEIPIVGSNSPNQFGSALIGEMELDKFGNRNRPVNSTIRRNHPPSFNQGSISASHSSHHNTFKCQYYGCDAKGSQKFVCLNYTQICDDFIDCQDESDELDCVSLLKHDSKSNHLSFSNGGGIIYLNRKGSLAPMCIDYFTDTDNRFSSLTNTAHDMDALQLETMRKQQELIRQINTIGQYACSLQSFSRLVSVKINHHDLVDSLNLIKTSKLYHRLSIVGGSDKQSGSDAQFGSYKAATSEYEVEVSTTTSCPSQRTVFVKCGGFECGQDSFSVIDKSNSTNKKDGVIINDFPWLVKLYWWGSLSCHGYLIDELWLISSSECFVNKSRTTTNADDGNGWTAEISYEHYGNDDYQTIESNRRIIKEIIMQPSQNTNKQSPGSSIVLAKFEKPIRFSPLNRPICLPLTAMNKTTFEMDRMYKDCVTATLPLPGSVSPTQDLILNRVKVHKSADCLTGESGERLSDDLICVVEDAKNDVSGSSFRVKEDEATRVLICSSSQANRSRSKWTVVGVQNKAQGLHFNANKQLFTTVSSQIDWIVDTMNPKSYPNLGLDGNSSSGNELNPLSIAVSQNQTCNRFKCSSGECLSWSRICDGLYDCSSHEDEKDCHK